MYDYDMKQSRWDITAMCMWFHGKVFNRSRDVGMP